MKQVTLREARQVIIDSYNIGRGVLLLGEPGIGKTEIFTQLELDYAIHEAPGLDESDVVGFIFPDQENQGAYYTKSALYPSFEKGILLIDEIASARPSVQISLHALFGEKRLGRYRLPPGVVPMATGNQTHHGAGARDILTALEDRMTVVEVVADYDVWKNDYAIPNKIHPLVLGFLENFPQHFCTFSKRVSGKGFATPRGYHHVSNYLYLWEKEGRMRFEESDTSSLLMTDLNSKEASLSGVIGDEASTELVVFSRHYKMFRYVPMILKGENPNIKLDPDGLLVVLLSCMYHVIDEQNKSSGNTQNLTLLRNIVRFGRMQNEHVTLGVLAMVYPNLERDLQLDFAKDSELGVRLRKQLYEMEGE